MEEYQNTMDPMLAPKQSQGKGMAIAALVLGILGVLCCCIGVGALFGLVGLILGIIAVNKADASSKGIAIAGLIVSIIALLLGAYMLISYGIVFSQIDWSQIDFNDPEKTQRYLEQFSRSMQR